jgi:hypothetical protein
VTRHTKLDDLEPLSEREQGDPPRAGASEDGPVRARGAERAALIRHAVADIRRLHALVKRVQPWMSELHAEACSQDAHDAQDAQGRDVAQRDRRRTLSWMGVRLGCQGLPGPGPK